MFVVTSVVSVYAQINSIPMLNGTNFKIWKEAIEIVLGCMDLNLVLRAEEPISTLDNLQESLRASRFLEEIEQLFAKNEKEEMSNLLAKLISMKYKGRGNIREYIMEMSNLVAKLKYNYLYLIHEKSQPLDVFKSFKAKVELQLEKKIKAVKSYCGGEYYGRYDGSGEQHPKSHFGEKLKTTVYILNRVPTKAVNKTPYELWIGRMKENWTQEQLPILFEMGNARFLEEVKFGKEKNIRNVVFEEESINDIGQVLVPITIQETTPVIGDNVQTIVPDIVPE
ncbi:hypothetical protein CR513_07570, partial [Mucuna pruriens]